MGAFQNHLHALYGLPGGFAQSEPIIIDQGGSGGGGLNWTPRWEWGKLQYKVIVENEKYPLEKPRVLKQRKESVLDRRFKAFESQIYRENTLPVSQYLIKKTQEAEKISKFVSFLTEGSQVLAENIKKTKQKLETKKVLEEKEREKQEKILLTLKKERERVLVELKAKIKVQNELRAFILNQYEEEALLVLLLLN